ncbi:MAG: GNAT family N-acetyltransferase [Candidatus Bathyarchaeia archaeon]
MITRTAKASSGLLSQAADLIVENRIYLKETFPQCSNKTEVQSELKRSPEEWNLLFTDQLAALFTLHLSDTEAAIGKFLPSPSLPFDSLVPSLQQDLKRMKIGLLTLHVPEEMSEPLVKNGFEKRRILVKLHGPTVETKLMPILPLNSPKPRDLPILAKLMYDSYEKGSEPKLSSVASAERLLSGIMNGIHGPYAAEASLTSGATQNIVSACFITLPSPTEAHVAQLYTHPLYRARGLATTEVATGMNKLVKRGVQTLTVWLGEDNEIAGRLFAKLGFKLQQKLVEMVSRIQ